MTALPPSQTMAASRNIHHRGHRVPWRNTESRWLSGSPRRHNDTTVQQESRDGGNRG